MQILTSFITPLSMRFATSWILLSLVTKCSWHRAAWQESYWLPDRCWLKVCHINGLACLLTHKIRVRFKSRLWVSRIFVWSMYTLHFIMAVIGITICHLIVHSVLFLWFIFSKVVTHCVVLCCVVCVFSCGRWSSVETGGRATEPAGLHQSGMDSSRLPMHSQSGRETCRCRLYC